ncbi:metal ABC transporter ATP-binding protein [Desulfococcus multivorans]|uniref:ABC transporter related protein n=1 Tax=Desulfococcus multivorans DSM 2059 TaxID=1121405 RepID=S7VAW8_DESML|nr:ABC transporter ATP-binding protein [Desulfococcus multivorans]AQV02515.1 manganese ABC transporter ATP-binding protein [Desulfococcus multivorans]EPR41648.1 ABC transporter related protein [Desulfococcus multivorans DSM 2059]SJZ61012.1 manganese/zinc/iron transport system ATP-binding protein [Desulfococcus multivorans DSM 2059]
MQTPETSARDAGRRSMEGESDAADTTHHGRIDADAEPASDEAVPLSIKDLTVAYQRKPVLWDVALTLPEGRLIAVVGPNGAGKSTLIKAVLGLVPRASGQISIYGKPYETQRHLVGYVPQRESVDWDFPVNALDVVAMGFYRKIGWLRPVTRAHRRAALKELEKVGMATFAHRQISQLSGGQQQRVFLARALAQDARIYLMDEPFAGVDTATERAIIALLKDLKASGKTCVVVHHDLQTVPTYFDHVVLLNMRVVAYGPTEAVFTEENLKKTYGGRLTLLSQAFYELSKDPRLPRGTKGTSE